MTVKEDKQRQKEAKMAQEIRDERLAAVIFEIETAMANLKFATDRVMDTLETYRKELNNERERST